ncbi:ribosomal protein S18-alanine N-acetyltransferase [Halanaerocella petrolearia]
MVEKIEEFEIIPLTERHLDQVLAIEEDSFSNPWSLPTFIRELYNSYAYYIVAVFGEEIIGYLGSWLLCDEIHITSLAVKKNYRRQGIATKLLDRLFSDVKRANYTKATLEVRESNYQAQKLYKNEGFIKVKIQKEYYSDNGEDAIVMWKQL